MLGIVVCEVSLLHFNVTDGLFRRHVAKIWISESNASFEAEYVFLEVQS